MIPVFQTDTTKETGNCLQACVASILEWPLEQVQNFRFDDPERPMLSMFKWIEGLDLKVIRIPQTNFLSPTRYFSPGLWGIAAVRSQMYDTFHAVVIEIGPDRKPRIIHDPNPNNTAPPNGPLTDWVQMIFIVGILARRNW